MLNQSFLTAVFIRLNSVTLSCALRINRAYRRERLEGFDTRFQTDPRGSGGDVRIVTERQVCALDFLLMEAMALAGWGHSQVQGWRFAEEVAEELGRQVREDLRTLAEDRLVDCVGFDPAPRRWRHKLYRINQNGAALLARRRGKAIVSVPRAGTPTPSGQGALYLTHHAWLVLDALVRRWLSGLGPGWLGERGWMTASEIRAASGIAVNYVEIAWLERRGFVERARAQPPGWRRTVPVYRATVAGRALRVVRTAPLPSAGVVFVLAEEAGEERAQSTPEEGGDVVLRGVRVEVAA